MIHPTAIIHPNAQIGKNVHIGAYTIINENVSIGDNCYISSHSSIGEEAEHSTEKYELNPRDLKPIKIGNNVVIREFVTVHRPLGEITYIGNNVYIMGRSHIAHDVYLEDDTIISNCAIIGGWTKVLKGANLGICSCIHQFTTIGHYAMVAANATVVKDLPPLTKYIPNKPLGVNTHSIRKYNISIPEIKEAGLLIQFEEYKELLEDFHSKRFTEREVYQL